MDRPGWIAARVLTRKTNELGQAIFAHTSPVYIDLAGERLFDPSAAEQLIKLVETGREEILAKGKFLSPDGRQRVQAIHDDAIALLRDRLAKRR